MPVISRKRVRIWRNALSDIETEFPGRFISARMLYLHELQEVLLQVVQPADAAVPANGFSVPAAQKTENFFFTSLELHLGQFTS